MTYAELAPAFGGDRSLQDEFLLGVGIALPADWSWGDTLAAHGAWARHVELRRRGNGARRTVADVLSGLRPRRGRG